MLKITILPKIKELIRSRTKYKIARGGRGSGKSYGIGIVLLLRGLAEPGIRILCTRETQNSLADSTLAVLKRIISDYDLGYYFEPTKYGLRTIYGTEFIFRGLQHPDRIRSLDDIKYCWVAEAHRIPEDAWEALTPTVRADNSEIWIDYNPDAPDDPVVTRFDGREDVTTVLINWDDNDFFPESLKAEKDWDFKSDPDKAEWIWNGAFRTISESLVFKRKYVVKEFETRADAQFYHGCDWGFSTDPTCLVRCYIHNGDLYVDYEAWGLHVELDDIPELFDKVPTARQWKILADESRPETISHVKNKGFKIYAAKKGKGSVEDGIEYMRSFHKIYVHPRCVHVVDEMKTYSYKRDRLTGEPTPVLEDKNNHCIDSLRYALSKARRARTGGQGGAGLDVL
jgi:phage terminase large subunit